MLPFLYNSIEFQTFIRSPYSFDISKQNFRPKTYLEISKDFLTAFSDHSYFKNTQSDEEEIEKTLNYFQYAISSFEGFEVLCKFNVESFYEYEKSMEELINSMDEVNGFYMEYYESKGFEIQKKQYFTNPYLILLDWCRSEILDLHAIIEAIKQRKKINKNRKKIYQKYEIELKTLAGMKPGKKKITSLFSSKSRSSQEEIVDLLEAEVKAIDTIFRICTFQIIKKEFIVFKQHKIHKHEVILRTFSSASVEEFRSLASQIEEIESEEPN